MPSARQLVNILNALTQPALTAELRFLKTENAILRQHINTKRLRLSDFEKNRLIRFALPLKGRVKHLISIVHYSTFRRWISNIDSPRPNNPRGRPKIISDKIKHLILHMARHNLWGYTKILSELKKLNIKISRTSIRNTLSEYGIDPLTIRSDGTWDKFLKRHFDTLYACDFFSKYIWSPFGPRLFYVLFFINIHTRKVSIAGITRNPDDQWVTQQTKRLSHLFENENQRCALIRDRDTKFSSAFDKLFTDNGMTVIKTPYRSPNMNPYAESWVATIKRECLNHFFIFGQTHFQYLIDEFLNYYNHLRPHSAMDYLPLDKQVVKVDGEIHAKPILGGLMHHYYRE